MSRRFGLGLLVDTVNLLLHFVITAYFFFSMIEDARGAQHKSFHVVLQLLWLGLHFSRIMLIVSPCSKAKAEVRPPVDKEKQKFVNSFVCNKYRSSKKILETVK